MILYNYSDATVSDTKGRTPLHLLSTNESVKAKKIVSLLLKNGSNIGKCSIVGHHYHRVII